MPLQPLKLDYFYGGEADQYSFYRIPKVLFIDPRYQALSMEAWVLYGLMLDRMGLSARNGWLDANGRVFIFFTMEDAMVLVLRRTLIVIHKSECAECLAATDIVQIPSVYKRIGRVSEYTVCF